MVVFGLDERKVAMRILSIDGGGIRGIIPATVLCRLPKSIRFDAIAGTSTGGILALGMAAEIKPERLLKLYTEKGKEVFKRSFFRSTLGRFGISGPTYQNKHLLRLLREVFGERTLGSLNMTVIIPVYDTQKRQLKVIGSWSLPKTRLVDVAMATSAAPTFFDPWELDGREYIDGGVGANNPALLAAAWMSRHYGRAVKMKLLSIGTGTSVDPINSKGWGKFGWAPKIASVLMDGNADATESIAKFTHLDFGEYHRMNVALGSFGASAAMDDVSETNIERLALCGELLARKIPKRVLEWGADG